jgi:hypothetical protein
MTFRPEGPGHAFIQQYERGLPSTRKELARCVSAYTDFLIVESGGHDLPPVDLGLIYTHFSLRAVEGGFKEASLNIEGANLAGRGVIMFDSSDIDTRQRFTQAHELLEALIVALEGNQYPAALRPYIEGKKKERLCNWGAARLLMPTRLFRERVSEIGVGIEAAERIAQEFETSRLATLRHMVNCYPEKCGLLVLKRAHKPTEFAPSPHQGELWEGTAGTGGPEKKTRVQWWHLGRRARQTFHIPYAKSVPPDSLIARSLHEEAAKTGYEYINLGDLQGSLWVEAIPFTAKDETHVAALLRWPEGMFDRQNGQQGLYP